MAPWTPQSSVTAELVKTNGCVIDKASLNDLSSDKYLWTIEYKLKKVQEKNQREPRSKDIIQELCKNREATFHTLAEHSSIPYVSEVEYLEDFDQNLFGQLQRKVLPERHAVNPIELKVLVENDALAKATEVGSMEENNKDLAVPSTDNESISDIANDLKTDETKDFSENANETLS